MSKEGRLRRGKEYSERGICLSPGMQAEVDEYLDSIKPEEKPKGKPKKSSEEA